MAEVLDLKLWELGWALGRREVSSREATEACLQRIDELDHLASFLTVDRAGALAAADASDARRREGRAMLSELDGVPIALKDMLVTEGLATTAGSKMLEGWIPPYDGAMSERLKRAGAVILGKTNLDEFAMGSSNEHSAFRPARNPWDPSRVPGGSSGGSAAAVASGQAFGALGTDTGGSIRQPAALSGVFGMKPTYGRVSRWGAVAYASSLDQIGPFGRCARDVALLLQTIAGHDPRDSTSAAADVPDYVTAMREADENRLGGLRIGIPEEYFIPGMNAEIEACVRSGIALLEKEGAELVPISLPHTKFALSTYYLIAMAEASSNLARYDGVRYGHRAGEKELRRMYAASRFQGFGEEVRRRIMLGTYVLSAGYYDAYYGRAQKVRTLIRRDFERAFEKVHAIVTPTSPVPAFTLGERMDDPLSMYLADVFTLAVNLAGIPGISVPAGFTSGGLPIGMQLLGPWFEELRLLRIAKGFENVAHIPTQTPGLPVGPRQ